MNYEDLSLWQQKMLRWLGQAGTEEQIAGKNRAPHISACRALVRKKLAWTFHTGCFGLTDEGRKLFKENRQRKP